MMRSQLSKAAQADGVTQSAFVRKALKAELFRRSFREARVELIPKARAKSLHTDEDVFPRRFVRILFDTNVR